MSETPDDPIVGKHDNCGGDVAECVLTKMQYCLECCAVVKAPPGSTAADIDAAANLWLQNAGEGRPRPERRSTLDRKQQQERAKKRKQQKAARKKNRR